MNRNYKTHIVFIHPFAIAGYKETLPAGTYRLDVEEERIEGLSFTAFKRKEVTLHLNQNPKRPGVSEMLTLAPHEIDAAMVWDRRRDTAVDHSQPRARLFAPSLSQSAIDRGENEGMLWVRDDGTDPQSPYPDDKKFLDGKDN
ncbi:MULTISPECIES: hypothetical protein [Kordiimonas]|jgi:hypothetical protein|uniref:hypothetical protein n=1 Tax=Kordiimonas TaxID=288021 RepID=UPI00257F444D|nr:hypothetical protein [Kordiimonas sp. UBA4487]